MRTPKLGTLMLVLFVLGAPEMLVGCTQGLDAKQTKSIKRIALAGPANPDGYKLTDGFGVGRYSQALSDTLVEQHLELGDDFKVAIAMALSESGYEVSRISLPRRSPAAMADIGDGATIKADALLDLTIEKAAYERRVWGKIGPSLKVVARLVDLRSGRQMFLRIYYYDPQAMTIGYTILRPPEQFQFDKPDDVLAHPDVVAAGFKAAVPMITADLAREFMK